jgi:glutamate dehydrogenase
MLIEAGRLIVRASLWMLRNRRQAQPLALSIDHFAPGVAEVEAKLEKLLPPVEAAALAQEADKYVAAGVPRELARRIAGLDALYAALDIVEAASVAGRSIASVAATYFALGGRLSFAWLGKQIMALPADNHWQTLAKAALRDDLASQQRALTAAVLQLSPKLDDADELIGVWEARNRGAIERIRQVITDLQAAGSIDLSMLSVALRELRNLA